MDRADKLLHGAIDMHAHGYPQFTLNMPGRQNNLQWTQAAKAAGMAGFVMKSHIWPTVGEAYLLNKMVDDVTVFGSITLNYTVGGINPMAVQIAAESGAKVVFMPTWNAKNDMDKGAKYVDRMRPYITTIDSAMADKTGISIIDDSGELIAEIHQVIEVCKQYGLAIGSGHVSIEESMKLCKAASAAGVGFILTHPLNTPLINASFDQMKEIAQMGGYIENVFIACMPMHEGLKPKRIAEVIEHVGAQQCLMSSDAIEAWNPPPPEILRMFIATMLALGISEDDIYTMTHTNPAKLLKLEESVTEKSDL
ncbi:MAG: DUF6282 family protein [Oscillospiraceae bacterium]|nr:DUF6282 family protein [Oscillospiraceae bacterium]